MKGLATNLQAALFYCKTFFLSISITARYSPMSMHSRHSVFDRSSQDSINALHYSSRVLGDSESHHVIELTKVGETLP